MTDSLTTINLNKKTLILYILLSFNAFSTNRYTIRLIYVIINGPEDPDEKKKMVLELRALEKYFQNHTS